MVGELGGGGAAVVVVTVLIGAALDDVEERGAVAAAELVVARVNGVVVLGAVEDSVGYGLCGCQLATFERQVQVEVSGEFAL